MECVRPVKRMEADLNSNKGAVEGDTSDNKRTVAILLAAYNGAQWIEEQILSILQQVDISITLYISIDPSTDGTETLCQQLARRYSNIIVLAQTNASGGAAQNFFRLLRDVNFDAFDYVAFSDQDDIWYPDKLKRATKALNDEVAEGYSSNVQAFWPTGQKCLIDKAQAQVQWDFLFEAAGPGCTYVLTKRLACALQDSISSQWPEVQKVTFHDWYAYAFARGHGYRWFIDAKSSLDYRQHAQNLLGANKGIRKLVQRYQRIHDGWWFSQVRLITRLVGDPINPLMTSSKLLSNRRLLFLSLNAHHCRRRLRDKIGFAIICWITILTGRRK